MPRQMPRRWRRKRCGSWVRTVLLWKMKIIKQVVHHIWLGCTYPLCSRKMFRRRVFLKIRRLHAYLNHSHMVVQCCVYPCISIFHIRFISMHIIFRYPLLSLYTYPCPYPCMTISVSDLYFGAGVRSSFCVFCLYSMLNGCLYQCLHGGDSMGCSETGELDVCRSIDFSKGRWGWKHWG